MCICVYPADVILTANSDPENYYRGDSLSVTCSAGSSPAAGVTAIGLFADISDPKHPSDGILCRQTLSTQLEANSAFDKRSILLAGRIPVSNKTAADEYCLERGAQSIQVTTKLSETETNVELYCSVLNANNTYTFSSASFNVSSVKGDYKALTKEL